MLSLSEMFVKKLPEWKVSETDLWEKSEVKCLFDPPVGSTASAMAIDAEMCSTLSSQGRISTLKFHSFWKHLLGRPYFLFIQMISEPTIHFKALTSSTAIYHIVPFISKLFTDKKEYFLFMEAIAGL